MEKINCYNGAMAGIVEAGILTKSQTGLINSMFYLVYAPLQIVGGRAADKYSPEQLIKVVLAVSLHIYERHLNPLMKWDRISSCTNTRQVKEIEMSTVKLFVASGFFVMVAVYFLRSVISQVANTLSPVMLMETLPYFAPLRG